MDKAIEQAIAETENNIANLYIDRDYFLEVGNKSCALILEEEIQIEERTLAALWTLVGTEEVFICK